MLYNIGPRLELPFREPLQTNFSLNLFDLQLIWSPPLSKPSRKNFLIIIIVDPSKSTLFFINWVLYLLAERSRQ
jgi:hypothetical protein